MFQPKVDEQKTQEILERVRKETPVPVFWLLGKTQSGKSSIVRYLTGAEKAEIGEGFQPCTKFSSKYQFPNEQTPLISFLDTRGLEEPGYDPSEDIAKFDNEAHVVLVVVKALDHATDNLTRQLQQIRRAAPTRPIVLIPTCLHEAYPQQQHPLPYAFGPDGKPAPGAPELAPALLETLAEQQKRFAGLYDRFVPIDLTPSAEGFNDPAYGGEALRHTLMDLLPTAQAQVLRSVAASREVQDLYAAKAMPVILAHTIMAGTAGAVPIPLVDLALISGVQTKMLNELANLYGQPITAQRMGELAGALGLGLLTRSAGRSLVKAIPVIGTALGTVAGGALAAASTYALGKAFCQYYRVVLDGQTPNLDELKKYYDAEFAKAGQIWKMSHKK
jgi:uncharacterized protein (DUF697 family)